MLHFIYCFTGNSIRFNWDFAIGLRTENRIPFRDSNKETEEHRAIGSGEGEANRRSSEITIKKNGIIDFHLTVIHFLLLLSSAAP